MSRSFEKQPTTPTSPFTSLAAREAQPAAVKRAGTKTDLGEVLEVFKTGFANSLDSLSEDIIREIRTEVIDAANAFRREAANATLANDRPVTTQLNRLEEAMKKTEQRILSLPPPPDLGIVQKDIRDVEMSCLTACRNLGDRLENFTRENNQMLDRLHSSVGSSLSGSLQRLDEKLSRLEDRIQRAESAASGDASKVQISLNGATSQIVGEVQKLQQQEDHHFEELDKTCAEAGQQVKKGIDQLSSMTGQISDQINVSGTNVSQFLQRIENAMKVSETRMGELQQMQHALQDTICKEVQQVQKTGDRQYTDFGFRLETSLSDSVGRLENLQNSLENISFDPVAFDIAKVRKESTQDFRLVFGELARIQQALHIDYLCVSNHERRTGVVTEGQDAKHLFSNYDMQFPGAKRVREFFTQTSAKDEKNSFAQTDPVIFEDSDRKKKKPPPKKALVVKKKQNGFAGADKLKEAAKAASMKPPYNVFDFYHETGCCQYIAKSAMFDYMSLLVVLMNAVWIAVDTDLNAAPMLVNADWEFIIVENCFCTYFTGELLLRFGAFQKKANCLRDAWFVFDLCLVAMMVAETWIVTGIMYALDVNISADGLGILRIVKLVKLVRLSRMARLLRQVPELIIIVKGLRFATRSVGVFFLLWGMIVYVFAVLFRQLTEDQDVGKTYFATVPDAMNTLFMNGVFAEHVVLLNNVTAASPWLTPILVFFMALVSLTLMYMLVGVLVDVVGVVAHAEKEGLAVGFIASLLREELHKEGYKDDQDISQLEFQKIMMEPGMVKIVQSVGVDVIVLADMLDLVFEQFSKGNGVLRFPDLVDVVLSMRGTNPATVKDCKEQIRVTKLLLKESQQELLEQLRQEIGKMGDADYFNGGSASGGSDGEDSD